MSFLKIYSFFSRKLFGRNSRSDHELGRMSDGEEPQTAKTTEVHYKTAITRQSNAASDQSAAVATSIFRQKKRKNIPHSRSHHHFVESRARKNGRISVAPAVREYFRRKVCASGKNAIGSGESRKTGKEGCERDQRSLSTNALVELDHHASASEDGDLIATKNASSSQQLFEVSECCVQCHLVYK